MPPFVLRLENFPLNKKQFQEDWRSQILISIDLKIENVRDKFFKKLEKVGQKNGKHEKS